MTLEHRTAKSREEAILLGLKSFTPDVPCRRGHMSPRLVSGKCQQCCAEDNMAWRLKNPSYSSSESVAKWREENPEQASEYRKQWAADMINTRDPLYFQIKNIRKKCRDTNTPYDIDSNFIMNLHRKQPNCPITGLRMTLPNEPGDPMQRMTIDRLDPNGGYLRTNVSLLSHRANLLKGNNTNPEIFRRLADWLEAQTEEALIYEN